MRLGLSLLSLLLAATPALAQGGPWTGNLALDGVMGLRSGSSTALHTLDSRMGMGVEIGAAYRMNRSNALYLNLAFSGIQTSSWTDRDPNGTGATQNISEYWRSLRFGVGHVLRLPMGNNGYPYVFYGVGLQETWVARTTGSYLGMALASILNDNSDHYVDYTYRQYTSSLDTWSGFAAAGCGWRFRQGSYLELRATRGRHEEFLGDGISTAGQGARVRRADTLLVLALGFRDIPWI